MTLYECRSELRSIINELRSIEAGVESDFRGIGQEHCADCIDKVTDKYERVMRKLNNVNYNRIAEWVIKG